MQNYNLINYELGLWHPTYSLYDLVQVTESLHASVPFFTGLLERLNEIIYVKCLAQSPAHQKHSVNRSYSARGTHQH